MEKEIILTKKECEAFDKATVCSDACRRIIEEVVKHFENNQIVLRELWSAAEVKYKLNTEDYHWVFNPYKKKLICTGKVVDEKINKLMADNRLQKVIREEIRKAFDLKGPK